MTVKSTTLNYLYTNGTVKDADEPIPVMRFMERREEPTDDVVANGLFNKRNLRFNRFEKQQ